MPFHDLFQALQDTALGAFMRENVLAFPLAESIHVLAITLVVGTVGMVDLRLLGVSARNHSVIKLSDEVLPITWVAFVVAAITGFLLFTSKAVDYMNNFFFLGKMIIMILAGINMAIFEFFAWKEAKKWEMDPIGPVAARIAGGLSLLFWIGVIIFGRWIGFTIGGHFGS